MIRPDDLRKFADHLEQHPLLAESFYGDFTIFCWSAGEFANATRELGGTIAEPAVKSADAGYLNVTREFGETVKLQITVSKSSTCEQRVVGKKIVPAVEAKPEHEVDVIEWVCPDSFLEPRE